MINFIPKAFSDEEDACPVCIARTQLESALEVERKTLDQFKLALANSALTTELRLLQSTVAQSFSGMLCDYRVAFALNLAIWFSAERYGRVKKVPDLLLAYDEYRKQSEASVETYKGHLAVFQSALTSSIIDQAILSALQSSHEALKTAIGVFFHEVNNWTEKRREEAFKIL